MKRSDRMAGDAMQERGLLLSTANSSDGVPRAKRAFVAEFEGLRGVLAAWVVFGHILLFSGFTYQDGWFGIVFSPVLGVYAFMMLSGFVITAALDQRPTTWFEFMKRRFFRLFPTYALCLGLAIVLFNVSIDISRSPTLATFGPENLERLVDAESHFGTYLLADVTLLQCLLPRGTFPFAHESFLPPTWSLTIEWLFYMVAPFMILGIRKNKFLAAGVVAAGLLLLGGMEESFTGWNRSFHLGNAFHFLTGIGSYYLWKHLPHGRHGVFAKLAFWGLLLGGMVALSLPYKIWLAAMAIVLYDRVHKNELFFLEWPRRIMNSPPLQFMGRTSYVTYLLHWIVIEVVLFWLIQFAPAVSDRILLAIICTVAVFPITYLLSNVIHRNLEMPMMELPKRWKSRVVRLPARQAV